MVSLSTKLIAQPTAEVKSYESYIVAETFDCHHEPCYDFPSNIIDNQFYSYFDSLKVFVTYLSQDKILGTNTALVDLNRNRIISNYIRLTRPIERQFMINTKVFSLLFRMNNTCVLKDNNDFILFQRMKYQAFEIPMPFILGFGTEYKSIRVITKFERLLPIVSELLGYCQRKYNLPYFENYFREYPPLPEM